MEPVHPENVTAFVDQRQLVILQKKQASVFITALKAQQ